MLSALHINYEAKPLPSFFPISISICFNGLSQKAKGGFRSMFLDPLPWFDLTAYDYQRVGWT